jgi:hypothetical protein
MKNEPIPIVNDKAFPREPFRIVIINFPVDDFPSASKILVVGQVCLKIKATNIYHH